MGGASALHYGTAWANIARWKDPVIAELGQEALDEMYAAVKRGCATYALYEGVELIDWLEACGEAYLREKGFAV